MTKPIKGKPKVPPLVAPLPCPTCGGTKLHVGHLTAYTFGVECLDCGLKLGREIPDDWPKDISKYSAEDKMRVVEVRTTNSAIRAWNNRP